MPVERPKRGLGVELDSFREYGGLALAAGLLAGFVAATAAVSLVGTDWKTALCLFTGTAGTAYYWLHYDDLLPEDSGSFERGITRNLALGWLVTTAASNDLALERHVTQIVAYSLVVFFVSYSMVVQARTAND